MYSSSCCSVSTQLVCALSVAPQRSRCGSSNADQRERMNELVYSLKTLEEYVRTGRYREADALITYVEKQYMACRKAFRMQQRIQQTVPQAPANP